MSKDRTRMTTDAGRPVGDNQNSLMVGPRGPVARPRRASPSASCTPRGRICTNADLPACTTANLFSAVGKRTPTFLRFSTAGGEKGSADTERDPRGFALKFYTEEGNWGMVGNNTPVFFIRHGLKFGDFILTQKEAPETRAFGPKPLQPPRPGP